MVMFDAMIKCTLGKRWQVGKKDVMVRSMYIGVFDYDKR